MRDPSTLSSNKSAVGSLGSASPITKSNRGRKANAPTSVVATATATATATAIATVPNVKASRGRGRPPKSQGVSRHASDAALAVPAGSPAPSEPVKTTSVPSSGPSPSARGRGRPPKSQAVSKSGGAASSAVPVAQSAAPTNPSSAGAKSPATNTDLPAPRGRGRPPKSQAAAKSKGTPSQPDSAVPSSNIVVNQSSSDPSNESAPPTSRGRGRPPKSQAIPKPASSNTPTGPVSPATPVGSKSGPSESLTNPVSPAPRGRGRPPKSQAFSKSPGGIAQTAPESSVTPAAASSVASEPPSSGPTTPAPRGRGRPPKSPVAVKSAGSTLKSSRSKPTTALAVASVSASKQPNVASTPSTGPDSSIAPETDASNESPTDELLSTKAQVPENTKSSNIKSASTPTRGRKRSAIEVIDLDESGSSSEPQPMKSHRSTDESSIPRPRSKKHRTRRSHALPVYEEIWKEVYLAGTEWDQLQLVYKVDWEFDHLDEALNEGDLVDKKVLLFGATEPQLLKMDANDDKGQVVPIPVIVAVVTEAPPPSQVGLKSVQKAEEEIVPMSDLRMHWQPFRPRNVAHNRTFTPKVLVMQCNERRARLRNMGEADVHRYDYVLPYFFNPEAEADLDVITEVNILVDLEGRQAPLMCVFDFEMDDLDDFVEEQLKENDLDETVHGETLKCAVRDAVRAAKGKIKELKEERKKLIDAISPEERDAIRSMKLIKFYPMNEWPDLSESKSKYINRYYGHANEIRDDFAEA